MSGRLCHILGQFSHANKQIQIFGSSIHTYFPVHFHFFFSQFSHIAQDCHFSSQGVCEYIQRSFHGNRVGIVAVIHYGIFPCVNNMESSAYRLQTLNSCLNFLQIQTIGQSHSSSCQSIIDHMMSRNRNQHRKASLLCVNTAGNAFQPFWFDFICPNSTFIFNSKEHWFYAFYLFYCDQFIIITI